MANKEMGMKEDSSEGKKEKKVYRVKMKKDRKQLLIVVILIVIVLAFTWRLYQAEKKIEDEGIKVQIEEMEEMEEVDEGAEEDESYASQEDKDSDEDGLLDVKEVEIGTDPENNDTDNDGYLDGEEFDAGYDPLIRAGNGETTEDKRSVIVSSEAQLREVIKNTEQDGPKTILFEDGTYALDDLLWIEEDNITIKSASGNRDAVILEGDGMNGSVTHVFSVAGSGFTARDLTLRNVSNHAIQLQPDVDFTSLINLHILDTGEQMVKVAYDENNMDLSSDNGIIRDSLFEYSAGEGPQYYIGGIDAHNAKEWIIRKNTFKDIKSPSTDIAEHAIHFWSDSEGTLVERNLIMNCDRGIGFGLGERGHQGGIIRNNMIYHDESEGFADVPISLESVEYSQVYNNTIFLENSYPNAIEYRFPTTKYISVINNLTNRQIIQRDRALGNVVNNITNAQADWFVDPAAGNLYLSGAIQEVVDKGQEIEGLYNDFYGKERPRGDGYDIGADEY